MIFRLMQTLNDSMNNYEHQFGAIVHFGDSIPPPETGQATGEL